MTFTKEQISQAFIQVLNERVPDLSDIPDHVFSERFEKKMNKVIRREAAYPWAVRHTLAKNLIAAAIVILLLFALCMSVSAIRNAIFNFFRLHFEDHDKIVFEISEERDYIETEYVITEVPDGFSLMQETKEKHFVRMIFENENGEFITFKQSIPNQDDYTVIDNERKDAEEIEIDGHGVYAASEDNHIIFAWDQDGYIFWLEVRSKNINLAKMIDIFRSVKPVI